MAADLAYLANNWALHGPAFSLPASFTETLRCQCHWALSASDGARRNMLRWATYRYLPCAHWAAHNSYLTPCMAFMATQSCGTVPTSTSPLADYRYIRLLGTPWGYT